MLAVSIYFAVLWVLREIPSPRALGRFSGAAMGHTIEPWNISRGFPGNGGSRVPGLEFGPYARRVLFPA